MVSGYQNIVGTSPAKQYFTLTSGVWLITFSGTISWNTYTTSGAIDLTLQELTTGTVACATTVLGHNSLYAGYFNATSSFYTISGGPYGLYVTWASGQPYCQSIGVWNITCQYIGAAQDPLSAGLPYS